MERYFLCHKDELKNHQTRSFSVDATDGLVELFVIRLDNAVKAYLNNCPHLGVPLNWQPDEFLSLEGTHIQCATHGALFTLEHGDCISGPCIGQSLIPLNLEQQENGELWLVKQ
jgi:nitrite reductase/ring-hydroxylating ferredoxin subunit